jgi:hypothetical protein
MLGVYFTLKSLDRFRVKVEAKQHQEDRWDQKTGSKLAPVIVVDEPAHYIYEIADQLRIPIDLEERSDTVWTLADELAELADAPECIPVGYDEDNEGFVIGRTLCTADAGSIGYAPTAAVGNAYDQFDGLREDVQKWTETLRKHGLVIEQSGIMTICSVS